MMMKAANGLKRGSRKKQQHQSGGTTPQQPPSVSTSAHNTKTSSSPPSNGVTPSQIHQQAATGPAYQQQQQHRRRPPTPEEAALTTKNFRLAKELNEMRVRHRDECKNVTRLTMENMNLASRCREAISHVAMLKQELAMHQRRAAESLAIQREQTQRLASNLSTEMSRISHSQSFSSEDILDTSAVTDGDHRSVIRVSPEQARSNSRSPTGEFFSDAMDMLPPKPSKTTSPQVYSTPNRNRSADRWTPKLGVDPASSGSSNGEEGPLFPHTASPKVVGSVRHSHGKKTKKQFNDEEMMPSSTLPPFEHQGNTSSMLSSRLAPTIADANVAEVGEGAASMSGQSINRREAFDASFDNSSSFPSTFSKESTSESTQIYNPFYSSPARNSGSPESLARSVSYDSDSDSHEGDSTPEVMRTAFASDHELFDFSGDSSPQEEKKSSDWDSIVDSYSTPPKEKRPMGSPPYGGEPSRPQKTIPAAARARYEKAMQPRARKPETLESAPERKAESISEKANAIIKGSPSALLKRIHQSRSQQQPSRTQTSSEAGASSSSTEVARQSSPPDGSESPFDEGRSRASMTSPHVLRKSSRRSISQPVSYAEPSLNTKLRKGNTYFPKATSAVQTEVRVVSPEQVVPQPA